MGLTAFFQFFSLFVDWSAIAADFGVEYAKEEARRRLGDEGAVVVQYLLIVVLVFSLLPSLA